MAKGLTKQQVEMLTAIARLQWVARASVVQYLGALEPEKLEDMAGYSEEAIVAVNNYFDTVAMLDGLRSRLMNGRTDSIPLHPAVVERLRAWLASKRSVGSDTHLFPLRTRGGHWRKTAKMMRLDLERAGLPYQDEDGLFADFHAHRHTFISNLGKAGVRLTTAQKLARHSDPKLTSNTYTHLGLSDQLSAVESLPAPPGGNEAQEPNVLQRTGERGDAKHGITKPSIAKQSSKASRFCICGD